MVDLQIRDEGTVVGFAPLSPAGRTWIDENLVSESWQWMGTTLWVDHRYAPVVIQAATRDGLEVASAY